VLNLARRKYIDEVEAVRLYEDGNSTDKVAEHFSVSRTFIIKVLRRNGVKLRKRGGPRLVYDIDNEKIKEMYLSGMDGTDIAKEFGISFSTIYNRLHKARTIVKERPRVVDVDSAIDLYCNHKLTIKDVAKRIGAQDMSVWRHLYERGLTRELSEVRKGKGNPAWRGGISFGKYCPKFNRYLKEEVRDAFDHRCYVCGAEENGTKLDVHHCDYNKGQGCGKGWALIPLCKSCHAKTGFRRYYWFNRLANYWVEKYISDGILIY
jgi:hypothetical protein